MFRVKRISDGKIFTVYGVTVSRFLVWDDEKGHWALPEQDQFMPVEEGGEQAEPGKWLYQQGSLHEECSVCGAWAYLDSEGRSARNKFCPNCGTKMEVDM